MRTKFAVIIISYFVLLSATGYLTFVRFVGLTTSLTSNEMEDLSRYPEAKENILKGIEQARETNQELIRLSAHSFDVILGSLLGFLAAVAAGFTNNDRSGSRSKNLDQHGAQADGPTFGGTAA